jgi:ATP-dependent Lhr-like helicase
VDDPGRTTAAAAALAGFSGPTRAWFAGAFEAPTAAQTGTWSAVQSGAHALVVAPTGSGKTLAAFLWALDGLLTASADPTPDGGPPVSDVERCRVLYVSPLKALAADVERNLRSPLVGIRQAAVRQGVQLPDVRVGVRTGDTPPHERRAFATTPPDILITTPESLFLVLTSAARQGLVGIRTVIVDEIHAVAGTKRGAHLALSLERLDALLARPAQRIGLSATVRPVDAVAGFLAGSRGPADGGRPVTVVQPPSAKRIVVDVVVPVPDLGDVASAPAPRQHHLPLPPGEADLSGPAAGDVRRPSVWPHVEERVVDLVADHRTTLVFTNSRRGAERLTARMNEVWAERHGAWLPEPGTLNPAEAPAQSGTAVGLDPTAEVIARAHHGSMSRAERTHTESELKAGLLPAVVATSSLELGIDMGSIDLVVQVGAPPSVASGLQRIGRAGHQVGAVSRGVVFPTFRGELVPAAVIAERMRRGEIEELKVLTNPLDVLAQQVVAMVALDDWPVAELAAVVRRAAPFATLGDGTLHAVLDMLAGRYPSEEFAELRARIVWDRVADVLTARPGAQRLAVTSGGTIPDRGLFGVFLAAGSASSQDLGGVQADEERTAGRPRGGKRVGELDEEMVYESRVGDTFTLGSSTWRIEEITPDRVLVSPAPGLPGRLPFWKGDSPGRPAELGRAIGEWVRGLEAATAAGTPTGEVLTGVGLDTWAADNLLAYLREQREATGRVPDDRTLIVERFRDEIGDWRVVIHSPYGARVHGPWALVIGARLRERFGVDAAAMHSDDGIVLRLPDVFSDSAFTGGGSSGAEPQIEAADLLLDPDEVLGAVQAELGGSAMFGARFREAAARALLLPRRRPDRRQPLWQQRQRSAQLLSVAAQFPDFPILLEAVRECLQDDFDIAALTELMRGLAQGQIRLLEVTTRSPSPFAQSLLFGYTAQFLYDGDAPLAERRAAALTLDPTLLAELLGQGGASQLADLLDPEVVTRTEAELEALAPDRQARDREGVADLLRRLGPLTEAQVRRRTRTEVTDQVAGWLTDLEASRRAIRVRIAGLDEPHDGGSGDDGARPALPAGRTSEHWAAVEDAGRLRDALGVALPVGIPEVFTEVLPDPLGDLVRRHARTHGPFPATAVARRFGLGVAVVTDALRRLEARGALASGRLRPEVLGGTGAEFCDTDVLRTLKRRSLAALRAEVEPVPQTTLGVFLPRWQGIGRLRGIDGLARAIEQLAGAVVPASSLETRLLARDAGRAHRVRRGPVVRARCRTRRGRADQSPSHRDSRSDPPDDGPPRTRDDDRLPRASSSADRTRRRWRVLHDPPGGAGAGHPRRRVRRYSRGRRCRLGPGVVGPRDERQPRAAAGSARLASDGAPDPGGCAPDPQHARFGAPTRPPGRRDPRRACGPVVAAPRAGAGHDRALPRARCAAARPSRRDHPRCRPLGTAGWAVRLAVPGAVGLGAGRAGPAGLLRRAPRWFPVRRTWRRGSAAGRCEGRRERGRRGFRRAPPCCHRPGQPLRCGPRMAVDVSGRGTGRRWSTPPRPQGRRSGRPGGRRLGPVRRARRSQRPLLHTGRRCTGCGRDRAGCGRPRRPVGPRGLAAGRRRRAARAGEVGHAGGRGADRGRLRADAAWPAAARASMTARAARPSTPARTDDRARG